MIFSQHKSSRATETLLPGQISYLKKRAECNEEDLLRVDMDEGCFGHLVLILSIDILDAQAEALIVRLPKTLRIQIVQTTEPDCCYSLRLLGERPWKKDIHTIAASAYSTYQ